jgi:ectoine hydroxylase-related dioxygenase (phytanoyl-CoA dioxygenase family)
MGFVETFDHNGFALVKNVLDFETISLLCKALRHIESVSSIKQRRNHTYAIRNLTKTVPAIKQLADSQPIRWLAHSVSGSETFLVRSLLFDKIAEANWQVAWHQDLTIAVKHRIETEGFSAWSVKAGIHHVQPPVAILESMLTLRIHLDDCNQSNGALQVIPCSHRHGRLSADEVKRLKEQTSAVFCDAKSGDVLLMRPLLLHTSSPSLFPAHRRVIHLEFAANQLPEKLEWFEKT